jgi:hypothetical protein
MVQRMAFSDPQPSTINPHLGYDAVSGVACKGWRVVIRRTVP